jgi:hypothetical protein
MRRFLLTLAAGLLMADAALANSITDKEIEVNVGMPYNDPFILQTRVVEATGMTVVGLRRCDLIEFTKAKLPLTTVLSAMASRAFQTWAIEGNRIVFSDYLMPLPLRVVPSQTMHKMLDANFVFTGTMASVSQGLIGYNPGLAIAGLDPKAAFTGNWKGPLRGFLNLIAAQESKTWYADGDTIIFVDAPHRCPMG